MFALAILAVYIAFLALSIAFTARCEQTPHEYRLHGRNNLVGKTVIITGGNSGIGYHVAEHLAARGARVVLACRDMHKASAAKRRIGEATHNSKIIIKRLDLTSFRSVREFCADILATEERVDVLINNAGAIHLGDHITEDGLQITWQVNYFAPFLLTNLLIEKLKSSRGKVINVTGKFCASRAYLNDINKYSPPIWPLQTCPNMVSDMVAYFNAKSALYESSFEMARCLGTTGTVCIFESNLNSSNFYRRVHLGMVAAVYFWLHILFPKPEKEAEKLVNLILRDASLAHSGRNDCLSQELWRQSCQLVKLHET